MARIYFLLVDKMTMLKIEELNADIEMLMKRDRKSVNVVGDQSDQINQELTADDSDLQADVKFIGGKSEVNPGAHCIAISILESGNTEEVAYDGSIDPGPMVPKNAQVSGFERVFVPRTPRFVVPHHLKESISERTLA
ncbi:hypothetical protein F2Q70_00002873 [Brassica cretica]|uniref:Uncharacterized protein n=1 Tax=Brassica cretica TaxID=69181 RepID=A0A8S9IQU3_BRACR|nr:hypothetical protein F2Q70_00002873 [Brassica cretica]